MCVVEVMMNEKEKVKKATPKKDAGHGMQMLALRLLLPLPPSTGVLVMRF